MLKVEYREGKDEKRRKIKRIIERVPKKRVIENIIKSS